MRLPAAAFFLLLACAAISAQARQAKQRTEQNSSDQPPSVRLILSSGSVTLGCEYSVTCAPNPMTVSVSTEVNGFASNRLQYVYSTTGGRINVKGKKVS